MVISHTKIVHECRMAVKEIPKIDNSFPLRVALNKKLFYLNKNIHKFSNSQPRGIFLSDIDLICYSMIE